MFVKSALAPARDRTKADYGQLKVLLVEDNQHMRTIVKAILKGVGIGHPYEARDGAEALQRLQHTPVDLAIVDYNMAPVDGTEFTLTIRRASDSVNPYLPVIMMTGHSELSRVQSARDAGINEFVVKPLTARALLYRMEAVVQRPRPFIRCTTYVGPDRRRTRTSNYEGPLRRVSDGHISI